MPIDDLRRLLFSSLALVALRGVTLLCNLLQQGVWGAQAPNRNGDAYRRLAPSLLTTYYLLLELSAAQKTQLKLRKKAPVRLPCSGYGTPRCSENSIDFTEKKRPCDFLVPATELPAAQRTQLISQKDVPGIRAPPGPPPKKQWI